jgi:hypothetical protein
MGGFSMKKGGKEVGPASTYAAPHDMKGKAVSINDNQPTQENLNDMAVSVNAARSLPYPKPKTSGIKVRGTGAATKGLMARGPMA